MSKEKDFLGSGKYGVVYGTTKYAIKQIEDRDAFNAEAKAYRSLSKIESLRGRIPEFHGVQHGRRLLYLQRIYETTLRKTLPDERTLLQIKQHLLKTISIIHQGGWCHGDINLDNIFASGLLFDFSHAHNKSELSAQAWKDFQKKDHRDIKSCYFQALGLKKLEAAISMLDSEVDDLPRQAELAEILPQSKTSPELLRKLEKIQDPTPSLALEICRAFRREGRVRAGMRFLQELNPLVLCNDQSRRLHIQIQGELAFCESYLTDKKACTMFQDVVRCSIRLLGRTDEDTIRLQMKYATFLEASCRYSGALDVFAALKVGSGDSLQPWTEHIEQTEKRLRAKKVKKRRREQPMPAEQTSTEDDKENFPQSKTHSPFKKLKRENSRESEESSISENNFNQLTNILDLVPKKSNHLPPYLAFLY